MRIAIIGGTGFIGGHLARNLIQKEHKVNIISRGADKRDTSIRSLAGATFFSIGINDVDKLAEAFSGCDGVAHCTGINREIGKQTYQKVHIEGTQNVIDAAKLANVTRVLLISFLNARPNCGSAYHESKWQAEEIVRNSGLDYTVIKAGITYGFGDHMLDHLSHAIYSLPLLASVGMKEKTIRPTAVEDLVRVMEVSLIEGRLSRKTVSVMGPDEFILSDVVKLVAKVINKKLFIFPMPVAFHYVIAWICESLMNIPLVAKAQVRMLSEGICDPLKGYDELPEDLKPQIKLTEQQILKGLPKPGGFGLKDLLCSYCNN